MTAPRATGPALTGAARLVEDTRRRFLGEILARVPLERLVEVHLFTPIRQGGVETGVAVVAARRVEDAPPADVTPEAIAEVPNVEPAVEPEIAVADAPSDAPQADPTEAAASTPDAQDDAAAEPDADADAGDEQPLAVEDLDEVLAEDAEPVEALPPPPAPRLTVFTARYRLTIKGPDRGKWDADVVEEADAPLVTVEAVVRGVQRRAGDAAGPDRLDADGVARLAGVAAPGASGTP